MLDVFISGIPESACVRYHRRLSCWLSAQGTSSLSSRYNFYARFPSHYIFLSIVWVPGLLFLSSPLIRNTRPGVCGSNGRGRATSTSTPTPATRASYGPGTRIHTRASTSDCAPVFFCHGPDPHPDVPSNPRNPGRCAEKTLHDRSSKYTGNPQRPVGSLRKSYERIELTSTDTMFALGSPVLLAAKVLSRGG